MAPTLFSELAELCKSLEVTRKRKEKTQLLAGFIQLLEPEEIAPAVLLVVGSIFPEFDPRTLEVGWRTVKRILDSGRQTTLVEQPLTILTVYHIMEKLAGVSGPGSRRVRESLLQGLISRAEPWEVEILVRIVFGEMRIGVSEGMMLEGIAKASDTDISIVRRALMLTGNIGEVAKTALDLGELGLKNVSVTMFVPLKPMLASMASGLAEVVEAHGGRAAFEYKFDGARIQIHRRGESIRIFSRRLSDVTESLPDIIDVVRQHVASEEVILEAEAIAVGESGKPLPFQDLMRRFTRVHNVPEMVARIPLRLNFFDILYLDGQLLIDEANEERWRMLEKVCPDNLLAQRIITGEQAAAETFFKQAIEAGHEGLMAKRLDSVYTPGVRGKGWFKIKQVETLDLVIKAADWGSGRRRGWLSNYHLAAREDREYRVIGKTFKGLTDKEFIWMTNKLQGLKMRETRQTVHVKPEVVVEVAFNEIQRSPQYKSGFALRFARITRIRQDKRAEDADTLESVQKLYEKQFKYKSEANF